MQEFAQTSLGYNRLIHFATTSSELIGGGGFNFHTPNYTKTT